MPRARRRPGILAAIVALVLVGLGAGIGVGVGDALGIRTESAEPMGSDPVEPAAVAAAVMPPELASVEVPGGPRFEAAVDELRDATADAERRDGTASLAVTVTGAARESGDGADDAYRLEVDGSTYRVTAASDDGAVRGVYDVAAAVRAGRSIAAEVGPHDASRLPLRMVDLGAVGVAPDPAVWSAGTDYSHASHAFADAILPEPPYVDEAALAAAYEDFDTFLRHSLANGSNAVAFPGFVEFVTFDDAPGGPIYGPDDPHRDRAIALRDAFAPFWQRADELGVRVYLRTDMLALTDPLEAELVARFGSLDTENPELWDVYAAGLDELYAAEPALDGVLIRVGEAGPVYDVAGWDVSSALAVTSVDAVRTMLEVLSAQAEAAEREVIFRSWTVGIGDVGDLHTDVDSYEAALSGLDSPGLIVSTKYTLGDFYSWLPLNETLAQGEQRRIVEFQSRREFEDYGALPNDLGAEYRWALQRLLESNDRIEGVWVWTQDGGPWRAGPMSLYLKSGFWQLYELNTQVAAVLAADPAADPARVTADWAREHFSDDPETVAAIAAAMAESRTAVQQGLYLEPFAEQRVFAIGLEPPPMMWIFEWDILTGDSAVLDVMYAIVRDATGGELDDAIAGGEQAVATAEAMRERVSATDPATWKDPALRTAFLDTLDYEVDTLGMLDAYRSMILHAGLWHDTGSAEARSAWEADRDRFEALAAAHVERYDGDVDTPAYNLTAAELGVDRAERDPLMAWLARGLGVLAVAWMLLGAFTRGAASVGSVRSAARAAWTAATRPWCSVAATAGLSRAGTALLVAVPATMLVLTRAVQTSFLSWTHPAIVLGAWLVFALVLLACLRRSPPWPVIAAAGGAIVLRCILALAAVSFTGPGGYWFAFWTEPVQRTAYIALAFACFIWVFVAAGWALGAAIGARRASGAVLAAVGAGLLVPAAIIGAIGLETAMTAWNDELGLLPWGLSRILGLTAYLEIPVSTPWYAAAAGGALLVVGLGLAFIGRRPTPRASAEPA
ncbi:hypothetical protein [Agromyces seonyuensis]|uniref:Glycosyl hydrolase family 67 C-terminal domain-containing protein n=1 Tax=Agromyces seonyuensis TaxID=2662446 RepID=A0A6I4P7W6_9MICO|nr:hypothetical protein [Agromyces seonyuensis]MWB99907.1 hypothetical protein [Agromyces seonyuensis]